MDRHKFYSTEFIYLRTSTSQTGEATSKVEVVKYCSEQMIVLGHKNSSSICCSRSANNVYLVILSIIALIPSTRIDFWRSLFISCELMEIEQREIVYTNLYVSANILRS